MSIGPTGITPRDSKTGYSMPPSRPFASRLPWLGPIVLLALSFVLAGTAHAADEGEGEEKRDPDRSGPFMGIGFSLAGLTDLDDLVPSGSQIDIDSSIGIGVNGYGGYRFGRWVAVDVDLEILRHDITTTGVGGPAIDVEDTTYALTGGVRAYFARSRNADFYARVGGGMLNDKPGEEYVFTWKAALGVDLYWTEKIGVNLNGAYVIPTGELRRLDYVSGNVSAFYRF